MGPRELRADLIHRLTQLGLDYQRRAVIFLDQHTGLHDTEIAALMGLPLGSVRYAIRDGRATLAIAEPGKPEN